MHVTGFLPDYGLDRETNAKLGCILECRIYLNKNHSKFIRKSDTGELFKNELLSRG